jgi:hypothetical protein
MLRGKLVYFSKPVKWLAITDTKADYATELNTAVSIFMVGPWCHLLTVTRPATVASASSSTPAVIIVMVVSTFKQPEKSRYLKQLPKAIDREQYTD